MSIMRDRSKMISEWHTREVVQCIQTRGRRDGLIVSGTQEERYLRGDIPCGSGACSTCKQEWSSLPADAETYVIPDYQCLERYLDCFEEESFCDGVIVLRSEIRKIGNGKIRLLSRLRSLYRDKRRHAYLFDDLHHEDVATLRRELPCALASAVWYWSHLAEGKRICLVIDNLEAYQKKFKALLTKMRGNVEILSSGGYFQQRWSGYGNNTVWNLFEAIEERFEETKEVRERKIAQGTTMSMESALESGKCVQGILRVESGGRSRAIVETRLFGSNDSIVGSGLNSLVHIGSQEDRGTAMHGDEVMVVLDRVRHTESGQSRDAVGPMIFSSIIQNEEEMIQGSEYDQEIQLTGKVVAVTKRQVSDLIVTICEKDRAAFQSLPTQDGSLHSVICVPFDRRFPKMRLKSRGISRLCGKRLLVRFIEWRQASNYPEVHLIRIMGDIGDLKTETDLILLRHNLMSGDFNKDALREVPVSSKTIGKWVPSKDLINTEIEQGRLDLRHEFVVSVDPPGCTDVDDAFHLKEISDGAFELGVHIADVSYFVKNNSLLDDEAAARCTTVYLVDRRLNMLPELISEDAASLLSN
eukprot:jgi/Picsp_1/3474/NSC_06312-R1_dis3-like exonuclease 1-like